VDSSAHVQGLFSELNLAVFGRRCLTAKKRFEGSSSKTFDGLRMMYFDRHRDTRNGNVKT
jgi:hypothetical protein